LSTFVPVAALLIVVPGPDVLLVVRNAVLGRAAGLATALGTLGGLLVHASAATVGLSALVAASATAFTLVKLMGAAYLVLLGLQALWSTRPMDNRTGSYGEGRHASRQAPPVRPRVALRQGLLTNVLNPKVAVFFVAFLPQFVPAGAPTASSTAVLAAVFVAMSAACCSWSPWCLARQPWPDRQSGAGWTALQGWSSSASVSASRPPAGSPRAREGLSWPRGSQC
jgi:threonine/homoserine/homoserine lactone efflux protein